MGDAGDPVDQDGGLKLTMFWEEDWGVRKQANGKRRPNQQIKKLPPSLFTMASPILEGLNGLAPVH